MQEGKSDVIVSTSTDGRVIQWTIRKGFEQTGTFHSFHFFRLSYSFSHRILNEFSNIVTINSNTQKTIVVASNVGK